MICRSRAPLRLGLAGGGTDVSPYSDRYGGAILNATIDAYAYASIEPLDTGNIEFEAYDKKISKTYPSTSIQKNDLELPLHMGVYQYIAREYLDKPLSFKLSTYVDAPPGSGLGSSSTLVVAMLGAFAEWLKLPLGEYDIARLAYQIERIELNMSGGKQDQYAATFGGVNFMEFFSAEKVIVNPLRIRSEYLREMESCLLLYNTKTSRLSSTIIDEQRKNVEQKKNTALEAMHKLKEQAVRMKEVLLQGKIGEIGEILNFGWHYKKEMAAGISNPMIEQMYAAALKAGAIGGKVSGAGGGGFMMFYCPGNTRFKVIKTLEPFGGKPKKFNFTKSGLSTWTSQ